MADLAELVAQQEQTEAEARGEQGTLEGGWEIDPESALAFAAAAPEKSFFDESGPLQAALCKIDTVDHLDLFAYLAVIELPEAESFTLIFRHGQTGSPGNAIQWAYGDAQSASKAFRNLFLLKTGHTWGKRGEPQSIATADDVGGADDAGSAKNRLWMHLSRSDYGHGDWVVWEYELKQQKGDRAPGWYPYKFLGEEAGVTGATNEYEPSVLMDTLWHQFQANPIVGRVRCVESGDRKYRVNFALKAQTNVLTGTTRPFRRTNRSADEEYARLLQSREQQQLQQDDEFSSVLCTVPMGVAAGGLVNIRSPLDGSMLTIKVPNGLGPGGQFKVELPRPTQQLDMLKAMGFTDEKKCLAALRQAGGDVERAVNLLC
eukprot:INCI679.4.p1 GENE.INCI679.4~~INCI679.4.p1  ORF type:complete len:420 (+),score=100.66 INCI679.4:140-1261(+)